MKKVILITLGMIGLILGAIGAILPLLPAFPFLMLAPICFANSSKRLHDWFLSSKLYKDNLESFVNGQGMTMKVKIKIMLMITILMSIGFIMMHKVKVGQIILFIVWLFHMFYFMVIVKKRKDHNLVDDEVI